MNRTGPLVVVAISLLSACAHEQNGTDSWAFPQPRISQPGYSIDPPSESGWRIQRREENELVLSLRGFSTDETYALSGRRGRITGVSSVEELAHHIEARKDFNDSRFTLLEDETSIDTSRQARCVISRILVQDTKAVRSSPSVQPMLLRFARLICLHPNDGSIAIELSYSHRYYAEYADPLFREKADKVFRTLEFGGK